MVVQTVCQFCHSLHDWMHLADQISLRNVAAGFNPLIALFCNIHWNKNNDLYFLLWKEMWLLNHNLYLVSFILTCHLFREEKVVCKNYWYKCFCFLSQTYIFLFKNITLSIPGAIITGVVCITLLIVLKFVSEKLKHKMKFPIPAELIVVCVYIFVILIHMLIYNYVFVCEQ